MEKTRILIVEANPRDTAHLKLNKESAIIENTLDEALAHEHFELKKISAATGSDLYDKLWKYKPNIVHFCGHGEKNHLLFVSDDGGVSHRIDKSLLIELFEQFADSIHCALFNACESDELAEGMAQHIDYAIGMNEPVWDDTSLNFATGFYRGLFKTGGDIKKAFQSGLMAVKFANLSAQQDVPVLKCKQDAVATSPLQESNHLLPDFQYDVLIHAADAEQAWAENFREALQKHLAAKFGSLDAFKLHLQTGKADFGQAACSALLLSPDYIKQYGGQVLAGKNSFVVECSAVPIPDTLQGLSSFRFWELDDKTGIRVYDYQDIEYSVRLSELANSLHHCLQQQQKIQASQQRIKEQHPVADDSNYFVFVNVAPQDKALIEDITRQLSQHGIDYILPPDDYSQLSPSEIRRDLENNFLDCDAVLLLCHNTPIVWVRGQLRCYRTVKYKRNHALKIIAVALYKQDELNMNLSELKVFHCKPQEMSNYINDFVEALK